MLAAITGATRASDAVNLAGFGRFKVADRAARSGRNPATGEPELYADADLVGHAG
jgi:DNA-binding protein HU-beta